MPLPDPNLLDPGFIPHLKPDIAPDSPVGKPRPPIPSEHAVSFAQMRKPAHRLIGTSQVVFPVRVPNKSDRGQNSDLEGIFAFLKDSSHIELPGDMHVVSLPEQHAVKAHL